MQVTCFCGKVLTVPDELAGRQVKCPVCGEALLVEAADRAVQASRPAAALPLPPAEDAPVRAPRRQKSEAPSAGAWAALAGVVVVVLITLVVVANLNRGSIPTTKPRLAPPRPIDAKPVDAPWPKRDGP